jgi:hypothetical protein
VSSKIPLGEQSAPICLYAFHSYGWGTASVTYRFLFLVGLKPICQIPRVRIVHRNSVIEMYA